MNFNNPGSAFPSFQHRTRTTLISGDRLQPGMSPYVLTPAPPTTVTTIAAATAAPTTNGATPTFPTPSNPAPQVPSGSDFTADWRSAILANSSWASGQSALAPRSEQSVPRQDISFRRASLRMAVVVAYLTPYPSTTTNAATGLADPPPSNMRFDTERRMSCSSSRPNLIGSGWPAKSICGCWPSPASRPTRLHRSPGCAE